MSIMAVEPWVEMPLRKFVEEARTVLALLLHPSGQVIAQFGFARAVDVMSACALAAAIQASAGELGRQLDGRPFRGLHHAGRDRQLYLAEAATPRGAFIFLTVFDQESSLGLVRLYFDEFCKNLAAAAPAAPRRQEPVLEEKFEQELNRNLAALFGRG
jgi:predicted regulator of Ras-like GTPase activity (Roadblock/LC7/MglB family)